MDRSCTIEYENGDNSMKVEISEEDFCMGNLSSSSSNLPLSWWSSSFNPDIGIQADGFDSFDPFSTDSSSVFDMCKTSPYGDQENGGVQDFKCVGFLGFSSSKDPMIIMSEMEEKVPFNVCYHDPKPLNFVFPDAHDQNLMLDDRGRGKDTKKRCKNRSVMNKSSAVRKCGRGQKKSKSAKGQWTDEEDKILIDLVEKYGLRKWSQIAQTLKGRIGKQCRERWHNHLRPDIKKDLWSEEEDRILIEAHAEVGNKWAEITKRLPGRTENSIKNHWNATKRRQFSRRKCRTKWPKPSSLLQNYIKNLHTNSHHKSRTRLIDDDDASSRALLCLSDQMTPDYDFHDVPELRFEYDNDQDFMDLRMEDRVCFDAELPLGGVGSGMKEIDCFDGRDIVELMEMNL